MMVKTNDVVRFNLRVLYDDVGICCYNEYMISL